MDEKRRPTKMSSGERRAMILELASTRLARALRDAGDDRDRRSDIEVLLAEIKAWESELANQYEPPWECPGITWPMRLQLRLEAFFDQHLLSAERATAALVQYKQTLIVAEKHDLMIRAIDDLGRIGQGSYVPKTQQIWRRYTELSASEPTRSKQPVDDPEQSLASMATLRRFSALREGRDPADWRAMWQHAQDGTTPEQVAVAAAPGPEETRELARSCTCANHRHPCPGAATARMVGSILAGTGDARCHSCFDQCPPVSAKAGQ